MYAEIEKIATKIVGRVSGGCGGFAPALHALPPAMRWPFAACLPAAGPSLADDFDEYALAAPSVEFTVENLLPWAEMESSRRDGNHHLASHDLPLEMGIGIVLADIVPVGRNRLVRCDTLQPILKIPVEAGLVVVDEYTGSDVHRIDKTEPLADARFAHCLFDLRRNVDEFADFLRLEPELFRVGFHAFSMKIGRAYVKNPCGEPC